MRSGTSLNVLPDIGLRVNDAHVGLIGTSINQDAIVHLQKSILCIILKVIIRYHTTACKGERDSRECVVLWLRSSQKGLQKVARQVLMREINFSENADHSSLTTFIGVRNDEEFEVARTPELLRIEKVDSNIKLCAPLGP